MTAAGHVPVLLDESIQALAVQPGGRYIDCTLGGGGHAMSILENSAPGGQLLGIDADANAIKVASKKIGRYSSSALLINDNFANLSNICIKHDFAPVHGILFDLGLSSLQLDDGTGFSFRYDTPLDMRFSTNQQITAADIVNTLPEEKIAEIIWTYGEEPASRRIARSIVKLRPVKTTFELVKAIEQATKVQRGKIHPATRTFQALRIAVNNELDNLKTALEQAIDLLGAGGRLVVISYHSLEDRVVKQLMRRESKDCICPPEILKCVCGHKAHLKIINKRVITPDVEEVRHNPRSRSARLRAAERIVTREEFSEIEAGYQASVRNNGLGWRRPSVLRKLKSTFNIAY